MNIVDHLLNKITMYRVVLYSLLILTAYSFVGSFLGQISFSPAQLLTLLATLTVVCFLSNILFAFLFKVAPNSESSLITALILYFLLWPSYSIQNVLLFVVAGLVAMLSKYVISYKRKHIFNPAAFAAFALFFLNSGGIWWIATPFMLPTTIVIGLLIVRKIRKFTMFFTFLIVTTISFLLQGYIRNLNLVDEYYQFFVSFPVIFFATVMLTEPLTMPPTKKLQMVYATLVGLLFSYQGSFGPIIMTTELVLLIGNAFAFIVSPKYRMRLSLLLKTKLASDTFEYVFEKPRDFSFKAGQYLEWTVPIFKTDSRGNRRYFTIASSPTEETIRLGIKHNTPSSAFKTKLSSMTEKETIFASQLMGDFTLPKDPKKRLVFIAGGIGITPFRSMVKYLLDRNEKRDIVLFYSNKTVDEIAYKDLFDKAKNIGLVTVYNLTNEAKFPAGFDGEKGRITPEMLKKHTSFLKNRIYFLSGPNAMVEEYKKMLKSLEIPQRQIVTDYFPGF